MNPRLWLAIFRGQRLGEAMVRKRHERAELERREALGSPPLSDLEVDMRYAAVEAERKQQG